MILSALGNVLTKTAISTDLSVNTRTYTYYETGELKSVTENGVTLQYEYDTKGLLSNLTDTSEYQYIRFGTKFKYHEHNCTDVVTVLL